MKNKQDLAPSVLLQSQKGAAVPLGLTRTQVQ